MREPSFWWDKPSLPALLLQPVAAIYGAIAGARMRKDGTSAGIPVICVGNFTLGGAGKTPAAIAIAKLLIESGDAPFFLSRGYGGRLSGPVRVDPAVHKAANVGDEPLLLARHAPTIVSHDRVAGAAFAREAGADVIVMDDGLQNPSLRKDFTIAVIDARRGLGNRFVFPAGPLRAPLQTQLEHAHCILLIGDGRQTPAAINGLTHAQHRPLLRARLEPDASTVKALGRRKLLAFAGIGDPEKFFMTLAGAGLEAAAEESFADHHPYNAADAERLLALAESKHLIPVTTEKDLVRLTGADPAIAKLLAKTRALPVSLVFEDMAAVKKLLLRAVQPGKKQAPDR
jgi:tetraacyldisaccharide 4'-kinase